MFSVWPLAGISAAAPAGILPTDVPVYVACAASQWLQRVVFNLLSSFLGLNISLNILFFYNFKRYEKSIALGKFESCLDKE